MFNEPDAISWHKTSDRKSTIDAIGYSSVSIHNEAGSMEIPIFFIVKGTGLTGNIRGIEAVSDRVRNIIAFNCFTGLLYRVHRSSNDLNALFPEFIPVFFKVQQLLPAKKSPVAAVEEHDIPCSPEIIRQTDSTSIDCKNFHRRKEISGVEPNSLFVRHYPNPFHYFLFVLSRETLLSRYHNRYAL